MRYVFNDAPPYVEQVALLLVISVAMFGAAAGVRDAGHIGLDSLVTGFRSGSVLVHSSSSTFSTIAFGLALLAGSVEMAVSTYTSTIPTLGLPRPSATCRSSSAACSSRCSRFEHLMACSPARRSTPSWH